MTEADYVRLRRKSERAMVKGLKKAEEKLEEVVQLLAVLQKASQEKEQIEWIKFYGGVDFVLNKDIKSVEALIEKIRGMVR